VENRKSPRQLNSEPRSPLLEPTQSQHRSSLITGGAAAAIPGTQPHGRRDVVRMFATRMDLPGIIYCRPGSPIHECAQATCQSPTRLLAPLERNSHHTGTSYTKPAKMITRTRMAKVSTDTLNRDTTEASSTKQVFRTVSTTLALVRVSDLILHPPLYSH